MASEFVLGTVQLGMDYGISGKKMPERSEASDVIDFALRHGIHTLDTARSYGEAESIIGGCLNEMRSDSLPSPRIVTKFKPNSFHGMSEREIKKAMENQLGESERQLGQHRVGAMLLHAEQEILNPSIRRAMDDLAQEHPGIAFGVSAYDVDIAKVALGFDCVDCVQVPASAMDQRMLKGGFFESALELGKEVFVRSVFLQGLVFLDPDAIPRNLSLARDPLSILRRIARGRSRSIADVSIAYAKTLPGEPSLVMGCRSCDQLNEDIGYFNNTESDPDLFQEVNDSIEACESVVIPSLWSRRV